MPPMTDDIKRCDVTGLDVHECNCFEHYCLTCGQSEAGCACYDENDVADDIYQQQLDERGED
jgi:hypothetical protein